MSSAPQGYRFATAYAGFRSASQGERDDVALVVSERPAQVAAVFTTNLFPAAPVLVARELLARQSTAQAVLINAGIANACTGDEGVDNCRRTQALVGTALGLTPEDVLPASTGVIGPQMPMDKWQAVVPGLVAGLDAGTPEQFAHGIMTTDAFPKMAESTVTLAGGTVRLLGMAKGAGMICPNMATMLCVVLCDAAIDSSLWRQLLAEAVEQTFNRVSVDGDTSTNDTVYALANGCSGVRAEEADRAALADGLVAVLGKLAYMLVQDGEGASKVAHIRVSGAVSASDAEQVARTVGHSQLVKTALYGRDANWGRIVAAAGRSGVLFDPYALRLTLCGVELFANGQPIGGNFDAELIGLLQERDITIDLSLGTGPGSYTLLASDLGHAYVDCNASYRS